MDNAVAVVVIGIAVTVFNSVVVVDLVTDNLDVNRTVAVLLFFLVHKAAFAVTVPLLACLGRHRSIDLSSLNEIFFISDFRST